MLLIGKKKNLQNRSIGFFPKIYGLAQNVFMKTFEENYSLSLINLLIFILLRSGVDKSFVG